VSVLFGCACLNKCFLVFCLVVHVCIERFSYVYILCYHCELLLFL